MKALVVGIGHIGLRHLNNLSELQIPASIVEINEDRIGLIDKTKNNVYPTIEAAFEKEQFEIVLICTPTSSHVPLAQSAVLHPTMRGLFIEKPISYSMDGVQTLKNVCAEKKIVFMTGCNLRFSSGIRLINTLLSNNVIGDILVAEYHYGYDLRQWHPDSNYLDSYSAKEHGGILLDDIHAIDILNYLIPHDPVDITGFLTSYSDTNNKTYLNIKKEEIADYTILYKNGTTGHIHSNYLSPEPLRNMQFIGTNGVLQWDFINKEVHLKTEKLPYWRTFSIEEPINNMYVEELVYFINHVLYSDQPDCTGIVSLQLALKLKEQNDNRNNYTST